MLADKLQEAGLLELRFNWDFFTAPDASDTRPEAAGLGVAILGSAYMMLIVLALSPAHRGRSVNLFGGVCAAKPLD